MDLPKFASGMLTYVISFGIVAFFILQSPINWIEGSGKIDKPSDSKLPIFEAVFLNIRILLQLAWVEFD